MTILPSKDKGVSYKDHTAICGKALAREAAKAAQGSTWGKILRQRVQPMPLRVQARAEDIRRTDKPGPVTYHGPEKKASKKADPLKAPAIVSLKGKALARMCGRHNGNIHHQP